MILGCHGLIIVFRARSASVICKQHNVEPAILTCDKLYVSKELMGTPHEEIDRDGTTNIAHWTTNTCHRIVR